MNPRIVVTHGFGYGSTDKSAFDQALYRAGVADFNLIPLSSVVPVHAGQILKAYPDRPTDRRGIWGDRLYCVMAEARTSGPETIAAGVGWLRHRDGRGVFVEHHASADDSDTALLAVRRLIHNSLDEMGARRGWASEDVTRDWTSTACLGVGRGEWACALVVAVIDIDRWSSFATAPEV